MNPLDLPQISGWTQKTEEFDPRSFIMANSTLAEGVALSMIMWPEFVEYRNAVFLKIVFDQDVIDRWFDVQDDCGTVESLVNHVHVWDMFVVRTEIEAAAAVFLAEKICEMWRAALKARFPDRSFRVTVDNRPEQYGPTLVLSSVASVGE
jgi:hypothetical protein